jgi:hypothetical protein
MDGWMDGWMDGCMDGWMDGWMDGSPGAAYFFKKYWGDKEYWHLSWRLAGARFHFVAHYPGA